LADRTEISKSPLHRWECGEIEPHGGEIGQITNTLTALAANRFGELARVLTVRLRRRLRRAPRRITSRAENHHEQKR